VNLTRGEVQADNQVSREEGLKYIIKLKQFVSLNLKGFSKKYNLMTFLKKEKDIKLESVFYCGTF